jgi:hypothetical protein
MFKKLATAATDSITGTGDNCRVYHHEMLSAPEVKKAKALVIPGETLYVILKSSETEFIFTDCAFTSIQSHSAIGGKKVIARFAYCDYNFTDIMLISPASIAIDRAGILEFDISKSDDIGIVSMEESTNQDGKGSASKRDKNVSSLAAKIEALSSGKSAMKIHIEIFKQEFGYVKVLYNALTLMVRMRSQAQRKFELAMEIQKTTFGPHGVGGQVVTNLQSLVAPDYMTQVCLGFADAAIERFFPTSFKQVFDVAFGIDPATVIQDEEK